MNSDTIAAVTTALDNAIAKVAEEQFDGLGKEITDQQTAERIVCALRSLAGLQGGIMPEYDEWVSLFYSLWYQPTQINLAYTLVLQIPEDKNPLLTGNDDLHLIDFACGALAMKFGLALAAADIWQKHSFFPRITVVSKDESVSMKSIGDKIWRQFVNGLEKNPKLHNLQRVCRKMLVNSPADCPTTRWLTALHVAYSKNNKAVKNALDCIVKIEKPDVVLITSHPGSVSYAFSPNASGSNEYTCNAGVLSDETGEPLQLHGEFEVTSAFRQNLYDTKIRRGHDLSPLLDDSDDDSFARKYLTAHSTSWTTPWFKANYYIYTKR